MPAIKRNYTITSDLDSEHIKNGRCPNYSLSWNSQDHSRYWPTNHNYFIGNDININDDSNKLRKILSKRLEDGMMISPIIFCDLDGVLADFDEGVKKRFKKSADELKPSIMWSVINKSTTFFESLPWMPRGRELWSRIEKYNPIILTGIPSGSTTAVEQKLNWCKRELGENIQVITCATKDKPDYCLHESILIDDRPNNLKAWKEKGGKFILYDEESLDAIVKRIDKHMGEGFNSP